MPEDTPELEDGTSPAIPLLPTGPVLDASASAAEVATAYPDPHLGRSFGTPPGSSGPSSEPQQGEEAPETSGRMRDLLARAVGERSAEERSVVSAVTELRELVPQLHVQLQEMAQGLEAQLAALGEHVAEEERATGAVIGERLQGITSELGEQAQLSAALSDALAAIAADLGVIPALHDAVRQLADQSLQSELGSLQATLSAQSAETSESLQQLRGLVEELAAQSRALPPQIIHEHLGRTAEREAAVQEALQGVISSLSAGNAQQDSLAREVREQAQRHDGLLEALEAVREDLRRPDDTREVLAALDSQVRQQSEVLSALKEHLQRPDDTREVLAAVGAQVRQQNDVLLALGEEVQASAGSSRDELAQQLRSQSGVLDMLREQVSTQNAALEELRAQGAAQRAAAEQASEREVATQELLRTLLARAEESAAAQQAASEQASISASSLSSAAPPLSQEEVAELVAASERRVTEHLDQTLYSLVELIVQRRRAGKVSV